MGFGFYGRAGIFCLFSWFGFLCCFVVFCLFFFFFNSEEKLVTGTTLSMDVVGLLLSESLNLVCFTFKFDISFNTGNTR